MTRQSVRNICVGGLILALALWLYPGRHGDSSHAAESPAGADRGSRFYFADSSTGSCRAVSVTTARDMLHTAQILPLTDDGNVIAGDAREQVRQVLSNLSKILAGAHSGMSDVVKLNVYVSEPSITAEVHHQLAALFKGDAKPALTLVATKLAKPGAMIAVDAVAMLPGAEAGKVKFGTAARCAPLSRSAFGILPAGPRVYVSGQAEKGDGSLGDATTRTLQSLVQSLKYCDLDRANIVQLKGFMSPMQDAAVVEKAVAAFFGDAGAPPLILVEWKPGALPIEIELIASSPATKAPSPPIEYLTPPELKKSPVYSRIARVSAPRIIYVSGLVAGKEGPSAADEVAGLFPLLRDTLQPAGSDLEHMAKATYYVADAEVSTNLNKIRPTFYHPDRPPTASKAEVVGTGIEGGRITIDMIAVPK